MGVALPRLSWWRPSIDHALVNYPCAYQHITKGIIKKYLAVLKLLTKYAFADPYIYLYSIYIYIIFPKQNEFVCIVGALEVSLLPRS